MTIREQIEEAMSILEDVLEEIKKGSDAELPIPENELVWSNGNL